MKLRAAAAFDARRDLVEYLDALERIFADGRLAAQHDGVGLLENGVGHVRDFRARRHGRLDHAFEHVRGDDDRAADAQARLHDAALHDGQFLVGDFDAQVAARHHDGIGFAHDGLEVFDRLLILDLGDDQRPRLAFLEHLLELQQIARFADKGKRDEIHAEFEAELHVLDVLGGEGGQADLDARQIDMPAAAQGALGQYLAFDLVAVLGEHLHLDRAVVNQDHVSDIDVIDKIGVIHVHGMFLLTLLAADRERELLAGLEIHGHADIAGADGGALGIHEDAGMALAFGGLGADVRIDAAHPVVRGVGHVQAEDVHTGVHELADHHGGVRGGAEGGNDFGPA